MVNGHKGRRVFVAMPFRREFDPVLDLIQDAARKANAQPIRVDELPFTGSIVDQVRSQIRDADLVVAVVTEENGNVYYEIGLAHCQHKPVVLLTKDPSTLKFDLRDHRALVYDENAPYLCRDELARMFEAVLDPSDDPKEFLSNTFSGLVQGSQGRYDAALEKARKSIVQQAGLQEPVNITTMHLNQASSELAVEVTDFMGDRVRAVLDANGLVQRLKKVD